MNEDNDRFTIVKVEDSRESNFCFSKLLFATTPTKTYTYTMTFLINLASTHTMIIQHRLLASIVVCLNPTSCFS